MYAVDEDDGENVEKSTENEEDLHAWCLLEENENEQWQEVIICKQNKQRVKKANQAPLLIVEVKDKWLKVRGTMDSGAAGHGNTCGAG